MQHKMNEITCTEDFTATLLTSGYSQEEAKSLTAFLESNGPELTASRKLELAETLSIYWLVSQLRRQATGPIGSVAAVEALKVLADISRNRRAYSSPNLSFNN